MSKCCVCRREREPFKDLSLTEEEKATVSKMTGKDAPETLTYCKACWQTSTNKSQGLQLFKGMLQLHLQQSGVRDAEQVAVRVSTSMAKKAAPKPVS